MTVQEIMDDLKTHGSDSIKKVLLKHGVKEPFFGVKIEYMKPIQKKVKMDYQLAKDLYATGNADAMYLAGLIADDEKMRSTMNGFLIALGTYVAELSAEAIATAERIGAVTVEKDGTACKVPDAVEYIVKAKGKGTLGKKKKTVKC